MNNQTEVEPTPRGNHRRGRDKEQAGKLASHETDTGETDRQTGRTGPGDGEE